MVKNKIIMIGLLLIAFISISIATGGYINIQPELLNENIIYLEQTHDYNGITYNLESITESGIGNSYCLTITELTGTEPCLNGNILNPRTVIIDFNIEQDTTSHDINGNIIIKDLLRIEPVDGNIIGTYVLITQQKTINVVDFDYNLLELDERIQGILFAKCIDRGECERPVEVIPLTVNDVTQIVSTDDGNVLRIDSGVMAEFYYTESKVPLPEINYCKIISDSNVYDKSTHYAYKEVGGRFVLDAEYRWVVLEGCIKQQEFCGRDSKDNFSKYSECMEWN